MCIWGQWSLIYGIEGCSFFKENGLALDAIAASYAARKHSGDWRRDVCLYRVLALCKVNLTCSWLFSSYAIRESPKVVEILCSFVANKHWRIYNSQKSVIACVSIVTLICKKLVEALRKWGKCVRTDRFCKSSVLAARNTSGIMKQTLSV